MSDLFPAMISASFDKNDDDSASSSSEEKLKLLAKMLRECANLVEKNQFHPILYQTLGLLHNYSGTHAAAATPATTIPGDGSAISHNVANGSSHSRGSSGGGGSHGSTTPFKIGVNLSSLGTNLPNISKNVFSHRHSKSSSNATTSRPSSSHGKSDDWCEEHFTMGCACKSKPIKTPATATATTAPHPSSSEQSTTSTTSTTLTSKKNKPSFQRSPNPNSNLLATGWIDQQRRSKMRIVWKEVLASLVEGRKPSEETTLWIQRQITNPNTHKPELEALHQIPLKWVEDVTYLDFYGDCRFSIKVYNFQDEFSFKCGDEASALNWVTILKQAREAALFGKKMHFQDSAASSAESPAPAASAASGSSASSVTGTDDAEKGQVKLSIKELRAIAHGQGIDTRGMERADLERIAAQCQPSTATAAAAATPKPTTTPSKQTTKTSADTKKKLEEKMAQYAAEQKLSEQLETENRRIAAEQRAREEQRKKEQEEKRRSEAEEKEKRRKEMEWKQKELAEERKRQEEIEKQRKLQQQEEERKRREEEFRKRQQAAAAAAAAEDQRKRQQQEEERKRQQELAAEAERRKAEELRRQQEAAAAAAEAERRKSEELRKQKEAAAAEQQRRWNQQQQEQYQKQQQEQYQKQQWEQWQWQQQQQQQQQQQPQQQQQQQQQHWQYQQQPQQQQQSYYNSNATNQQQAPSQQQQQNNHSTSFNEKYAKAMTDEVEAVAITAIKRNVLITWALQPPMLQTLRPVDQLVSSIHHCLPPAFGIPTHDYFSKFKPLSPQDLQISAAMAGPNEEKVKKAVRKIRVFLHPDKLPNDLNAEQKFLCKMLWDVTSDAWEEFCTKNEELDWIRS